MSHPDDGMLAALLDGELSGEVQRELETHLRGCAVCRARLEDEQSVMTEADGMIEEIEVPGGIPAPAAAPWWERYQPLAWAATIVLAAGLGYAGGEWGSGPERAVPVSESTATVSARPEAARVTAEPAGGIIEGERSPEPSPAAAVPEPPRAESRSRDPARQQMASQEMAEAGDQAKGALSPLEDAVKELGGSIMLIDGLEPELIQNRNGVVLVTYLYPSRSDTVTLEQTRSDVREITSPEASKLHDGNVMARQAAVDKGLKWSQNGFELRLFGTVPDSVIERLRQRVQ